MRAFVKRAENGEVTIYGNTGNDDAQNRRDFDQFGFWDSDPEDQHLIVDMEIDIPDPVPVPVVKARGL